MAKYKKKRARELKHDRFRDTTMLLADRMADRVAERVTERMETMTPEERERIRERMRERWGTGPTGGETRPL